MNLKTQFEGLLRDESIQLSDRVNKFLNELESADEDLLWLQCLESAGVDNWSGCDYASDLLREEMDNESC